MKHFNMNDPNNISSREKRVRLAHFRGSELASTALHVTVDGRNPAPVDIHTKKKIYRYIYI